jgi:hypothetical protein
VVLDFAPELADVVVTGDMSLDTAANTARSASGTRPRSGPRSSASSKTRPTWPASSTTDVSTSTTRSVRWKRA